MIFHCIFELPEAFTTRIHQKTCKNPPKKPKTQLQVLIFFPKKQKSYYSPPPSIRKLAFYTRVAPGAARLVFCWILMKICISVKIWHCLWYVRLHERFSLKPRMWEKITHFGENLTKYVTFSLKCVIFVDFHENRTFSCQTQLLSWVVVELGVETIWSQNNFCYKKNLVKNILWKKSKWKRV